MPAKMNKDRTIYFENSSVMRGSIIARNICHISEVMEFLYDCYPNLNKPTLKIRIADKRMGAFKRKILDGELLAEHDDLYVYLSIITTS
jgi:hypothetical protein